MKTLKELNLISKNMVSSIAILEAENDSLRHKTKLLRLELDD